MAPKFHRGAADPERIVEWFMVESWAWDLRRHKRVSNTVADLQALYLYSTRDQPSHKSRIIWRCRRNGQAGESIAPRRKDDIDVVDVARA